MVLTPAGEQHMVREAKKISDQMIHHDGKASYGQLMQLMSGDEVAAGLPLMN